MSISVKSGFGYCIFRQAYAGGANYIGYGKLAKSLELKYPHLGDCVVDILETFEFPRQAQMEFSKYKHLSPPILTEEQRFAKINIMCNETYEVFPSTVVAAQVLGISQSGISNHLNKRAGYDAPKGFTFCKVQDAIMSCWHMSDADRAPIVAKVQAERKAARAKLKPEWVPEVIDWEAARAMGYSPRSESPWTRAELPARRTTAHSVPQPEDVERVESDFERLLRKEGLA